MKPHSFIIGNWNNKEYIHVQLQLLGKKTKQPTETITAFDRVIVTEQIKNWEKSDWKKSYRGFFRGNSIAGRKDKKKSVMIFFGHLRDELFRYVKRSKWTKSRKG